MGSPSAQKDDNMRVGISCALFQAVIKEINKEKNRKPGEYTVVENEGRKDNLESQIAQLLEEVKQARVKGNECGYDEETNTMIRVVNSKEIAVRDKNSFKSAYKEMKNKGKTYKGNNQKIGYDLEEK